MQELKTYGGRYSEQIALSWVIRAYKRIFYGKTVIEDNCYIKPNVIIQKDTKIGKGFNVGACSLVNQDILPRSKAYGTPLKIEKM